MIKKSKKIFGFIGIGLNFHTKQVNAGEILRIHCYAEIKEDTRGIAWSFPESLNTIPNRYEITAIKMEENRTRLYKSTLSVRRVVFNDTGYYTCMYEHNLRNKSRSYESILSRNNSNRKNWIKKVYVYAYGTFVFSILYNKIMS